MTRIQKMEPYIAERETEEQKCTRYVAFAHRETEETWKEVGEGKRAREMEEDEDKKMVLLEDFRSWEVWR